MSFESERNYSLQELKEMNRKSAEWWTGLLTEGEGGVFPRWNIGAIQDIIYTAAEEKTLIPR